MVGQLPNGDPFPYGDPSLPSPLGMPSTPVETPATTPPSDIEKLQQRVDTCKATLKEVENLPPAPKSLKDSDVSVKAGDALTRAALGIFKAANLELQMAKGAQSNSPSSSPASSPDSKENPPFLSPDSRPSSPQRGVSPRLGGGMPMSPRVLDPKQRGAVKFVGGMPVTPRSTFSSPGSSRPSSPSPDSPSANPPHRIVSAPESPISPAAMAHYQQRRLLLDAELDATVAVKLTGNEQETAKNELIRKQQAIMTAISKNKSPSAREDLKRQIDLIITTLSESGLESSVPQDLLKEIESDPKLPKDLQKVLVSYIQANHKYKLAEDLLSKIPQSANSKAEGKSIKELVASHRKSIESLQQEQTKFSSYQELLDKGIKQYHADESIKQSLVEMAVDGNLDNRLKQDFQPTITIGLHKDLTRAFYAKDGVKLEGDVSAKCEQLITGFGEGGEMILKNMGRFLYQYTGNNFNFHLQTILGGLSDNFIVKQAENSETKYDIGESEDDFIFKTTLKFDLGAIDSDLQPEMFGAFEVEREFSVPKASMRDHDWATMDAAECRRLLEGAVVTDTIGQLQPMQQAKQDDDRPMKKI